LVKSAIVFGHHATEANCIRRSARHALHGHDDRCVLFEQSRLIASGIRGARLAPLACINHTPLPDEPAFAEMNRLIDGFLLQTPDLQSTGPGVERPQLRLVSAVRSSR
jgi:hypothetical protein